MLSSPFTNGSSGLAQIFPGQSEMAARMRAFDWSRTDLGPPADWPQHLRIAVSLCLTSRFPILLWWGPNLTVLYNDAYIPFLGETKHPRVLGRPGQEVWGEIWDTIGPMLEGVRATGEATWSDDSLFFFARKLPREEVYVQFTYGPILSADGRTVDGIFCPCTEVTDEVVGARRLETLRKLGVKPAVTWSVAEACRAAVDVLGENPYDIPFAGIYLVGEESREANLCAAVGIAPGGLQLPPSVSFADVDPPGPLPLATVLRTKRPADSADLGSLDLRLSFAPSPESVRTAVMLPIAAAAHENLAGLLVVGVSPHRPLDAAYRTFFDLIAGHIGAAIADARAYEEERRRAEALAELDHAKTAFFSNVSHEFRTPLTLLLGPLEEELRQSPEARERLAVAHRNALRLLRLVNTLLDFSRIEAGRVQAVYEPTDLSAYTAELGSVFRSAIEKAGLRLVIDCPPLPEPVFVDREMWEKVVLNLLSNAFKFTFEGEIRVELRWRGDRAELAVIDTGVGIAEGELSHVFERFHRVRGARARTHEGTGIGLALVRELVRLHGGDIGVQSVEGQGTTFTVILPAGTAHLPRERIGAARSLASTAMGAAPFVEEALRWLPDEASASEPPPADAHREPNLGDPPAGGVRARVLVADDNADMREYIRRLLASRYEVVTAADGQAALAAARERPPDLVLTDVMMPRLDGFGLLRELRADPRTATLPIVLLSARVGEEARVEGLAHGADDYLVKPFAARELLARVGTHLELSRVRWAAQAELLEANERLQVEVRERERAEAARIDLTRRLSTLQEDERQRISRDLHDSIGQLLAGLSLAVSAAVSAGTLPPPAAARLGDVQRIAEDLGRQVHGLAIRLRPTALDDLGLTTALGQLVGEWSARAAVPADFQTVGLDGARLPAEVETVLYRVVQEALTNVAKHARARQVSVIVSRHEGYATAVVEDDGGGFDPETAGGGRLGLVGMRERVTLAGGELDVESTPGAGTTVIARVPVGNNQGKESHG